MAVEMTTSARPTRVFVSYSRGDLAFADKLVSALEARGLEVMIDRRDLPEFEDWKRELADLIRRADTIILVISPRWIGSPTCRWEVEQVEQQSKRLAPIVLERVADDQIPPNISRLNYVFFDAPHDFEQQADRLAKALESDIAWIREHTRLGEIARRWAQLKRGDALILRGQELEGAEQWLVKRPRAAPEPTAAHGAFLQASRRAARRRQWYWTIGTLSVAIVTAALAAVAYFQKQEADQRRVEAVANAEMASRNEEVAKANEQRAVGELARAQRSESLALAEQSLRETEAGDALEGVRRALQGLPKNRQRPDRPLVQRAELALAKAMLANRLELALKPGADQVNHAVYSPDGTRIAAGTRDGKIAVWDAGTGRVVRIFSDDRKAIYNVAFSPDGKRLASAHQFPLSIVVRNLETGAIEADLPLQNQNGFTFFSPRQPNQLISIAVQMDLRPRIWDLASRRQGGVLDLLLPGIASVRTAAVSPDGDHLAITCYGLGFEGSFFVWDLDHRRLVMSDTTLLPAQAEAAAMTKLGDGEEQETIAAVDAAGDSGRFALLGKRTIYVVDSKTRSILHRWQYAANWNAGMSGILKVTRNGAAVLVAPTPTELALHVLESGRRTALLRGHASTIVRAAVSADGARVAAAASDRTIRVWDTATEKQIAVLRGFQSSIRDIEFSKDGTRLMSYGDSVVRVWDLRPDRERLAAHMPSSDWSPEIVDSQGTLAILARREPGNGGKAAPHTSTIGLWRFSDARMLRELQTSAGLPIELEQSAFARDAPILALSRRMSRQAESGEAAAVQAEQARLGALIGAPSRAGPSAGDQYVAIEVLDAATGATTAALPLAGSEGRLFGNELTLAPDGARAAVSRSEYGERNEESRTTSEIWDIAEARRILSIEQAGNEPALKLSADGRTAILATKLKLSPSEEGLVSVWDLSNLAKVGEARWVANSTSRDPSLLEQQKRLLLAGTSGIPTLRDLATVGEVGRIAGQRMSISRVNIDPDRRHLLATPAESAPVGLWRIPTRKHIADLPSRGAQSVLVSFSGDGQRVLTSEYRSNGGGGTRTFELFDTATGRNIRKLGEYPDSSVLEAYAGRTGRYTVVRTSPTEIQILTSDDGTAPARRIQLANPLYRWRLTDTDTRLVTADRSGAVQVWDTSSGALVFALYGADSLEPLGEFNETLRRIPVILADGSALVLDTSSGVVIWRAKEFSGIIQAKLSPDEATVVMVSPKDAEVIAVSSGESLGKFPCASGRLPTALFSADSRRLFLHVRGGTSVLLDLTAKSVLARYDGADLAVLEEDRGAFLALATQSELGIFDGSTGERRHTIRLDQPLDNLIVNSRLALLAAADMNAKVFVANVATGMTTKVVDLRRIPRWLSFTDGAGEILIMEDGGRLTLRNIANGNIISDFASDWHDVGTSLNSWVVRVAPTGAYVAVRAPDQYIHIYRTTDGSRASFFNWDDRKLVDFAFSQDGRLLVVVAANGDVAIWNVQAGKGESWTSLGVEFRDHFSGKTRLKLSGTQLLMPDSSGRIHVLSLNTFSIRTFFAGQPEEDVVPALSPNASLLATVSKTGMLRIWHVGLTEVMAEMNLAWKDDALDLARLRFSADGHRLIVERDYEHPRILSLPLSGETLVDLASERLAELAPPAAAPASTAGVGRYRLGVFVTDVPPAAAQRSGIEAGTGALITEVLISSPAMEAGLLVGDIILSVGGRTIRGQGALPAAVRDATPNHDVEIRYSRNGRPGTLTLRLPD
ncbi:hypothetical protein C5688_10745 [Methylocystis sp. MitZ-2018]|nr:hypothetical protein C5688_10745 [Methylocystis sp. MitZ-2018]